MALSAQDLHVGQEVPPLEKAALMKGDFAWGSPHNDEYAREVLKFRGGLVIGVITMAYVAEMLRRFFGPAWLEHGALEVNFIGGGAVNNDKVAAKGVITGLKQENGKTRVELDVWLENEALSGQRVIAGTANCLI